MRATLGLWAEAHLGRSGVDFEMVTLVDHAVRPVWIATGHGAIADDDGPVGEHVAAVDPGDLHDQARAQGQDKGSMILSDLFDLFEKTCE